MLDSKIYFFQSEKKKKPKQNPKTKNQTILIYTVSTSSEHLHWETLFLFNLMTILHMPQQSYKNNRISSHTDTVILHFN